MMVVAAVIVAVAIVWSAQLVAGRLAAARDDTRRAHVLTILQLFTPGLAAAQQDPRALIVWQPLARGARTLFPDAFAEIDRAMGATFPFTREALQAAHARWTTDWLAWERSHDATYKRKAAEIEHDPAVSGSALVRARLDGA